MLITPFHFICHTEERLRAQMIALDPALERYLKVQRRFNMEENFSLLQFGKRPELGEEFQTHATFQATLVPQKENKIAFNCHFRCKEADMELNFRILLRRVEEAEMQIMKIVEMLQKAFAPLDYKNATFSKEESKHFVPITKEGEPEDFDDISEEELAAILDTGGSSGRGGNTVDPNDPLAGLDMGSDETTEVPEPQKKKYYVENVHSGETVQLKDASGAYVPAGALPATLRINNTEPPMKKEASTQPEPEDAEHEALETQATAEAPEEQEEAAAPVEKPKAAAIEEEPAQPEPAEDSKTKEKE